MSYACTAHDEALSLLSLCCDIRFCNVRTTELFPQFQDLHFSAIGLDSRPDRSGGRTTAPSMASR
jgi:hypothetical protein